MWGRERCGAALPNPPAAFAYMLPRRGMLGDERLSLLLRHRLEALNLPAAVLGDVDVALGVDRDAVRLVELARIAADATKARELLAGLAFKNLDLRVVLVDDEHQ